MSLTLQEKVDLNLTHRNCNCGYKVCVCRAAGCPCPGCSGARKARSEGRDVRKQAKKKAKRG